MANYSRRFALLQEIFQIEALGFGSSIRLIVVASFVFWADEGSNLWGDEDKGS
jgi:hypothetical protein